ncbi:MAG: MFS transporter [Syntrophus sp. (in: bacteria)]
MANISSPRKLWSFEFLALCLIIAVAFGNVSVFYSFYHYLGTIGIPIEWRGFLVGLEPMSAFILRLFVLPWLHVRNAFSVTMVSLILLIVASCTYQWVTTVPAMIVLRIFHGAVFVLLTSAVISLVVNFIPGDKSGQGFSAISIATMIPYAVIPPLSEALLPYVSNEADIYAAVSIFSVVAIFLLIAIRGRLTDALRGMDSVLLRRPNISEIRENLRLRSVIILIASIFLIYLAHATLFYFLKDLSLQIHSGDVGLFFTISMATMISVRALGAALFDRTNKLSTLQKALALLIPCLILLPLAVFPTAYYLLATLYGLSMGVILPLLNAVLFSASPPLLRGLNTNMTLFTMDVAYFVVPYLGGMLIAFGAGFDILFYIAAGFVMLSLALIITLSYIQKNKLTV